MIPVPNNGDINEALCRVPLGRRTANISLKKRATRALGHRAVACPPGMPPPLSHHGRCYVPQLLGGDLEEPTPATGEEEVALAVVHPVEVVLIAVDLAAMRCRRTRRVCAVAGGGCTFMQRRGWRCWPLLHVPPWTEEAAPSCAAMGGRGCLDSVTMRQSQGRG